jgi:hypothetical protein
LHVLLLICIGSRQLLLAVALLTGPAPHADGQGCLGNSTASALLPLCVHVQRFWHMAAAVRGRPGHATRCCSCSSCCCGTCQGHHTPR